MTGNIKKSIITPFPNTKTNPFEFNIMENSLPVATLIMFSLKSEIIKRGEFL
jgi:hypothetical protein